MCIWPPIWRYEWDRACERVARKRADAELKRVLGNALHRPSKHRRGRR